MGFDKDSFNQFIIKNNVYGFFKTPITLSSGRKSHFYANWRSVVYDVFLAEKLAEYVVRFTKSHNIYVDTFYGVPEGATKIGILSQLYYAKSSKNFSIGSHVLAMGRAKVKEHGALQDKYFVGAPRGNTVVLEDVTTTGGSLLKAISYLKQAGVSISAVISLTNRMEKRDDGLSVSEVIINEGIPFFAMSSALEILPKLILNEKLSPDMTSALIEEFNKYGVMPLEVHNEL
ncbi:MAG: orotate phosphoribosyltransferase [Candidatus Woesearchaeota archaeon]